MKPPKRFLILLLIFQICFYFVENRQTFGQYRFDNWTTDNGLPQNGVRKIAQTPDGYLWFTTFDGLVRFDGVNFTTFNKGNTKGISNNRFTDVYVDKDGILYATTMEDGILTVYRNGVFSTYNSGQVPGHYIQKIEPDENGKMRFLVEDEDRTSKSWYYLREEKFVFSKKISREDEKKIIFQGKSGAKWIVTPTQTTEIRNDQTHVYNLNIGELVGRVSVFEDREGSLWIGENMVHRLQNGKIESFAEKDGFPRKSLYHSFWEEKDGSLWFSSGGSSSYGIGLIQYQNGKFSFWQNKDDVANTSISSVFRDREGIVWLATNKGLSRLRKEVMHGFSVKDGINYSEVYPMMRDSRENVWIGTSKGLSVYRNGKFETVNFKSLHPNTPPELTWRDGRESVQSLFEDANGKMWIGLNGGIFVTQNGYAEKIEGGRNSHVYAIKADREGNIWAATNKGLLRFRDYKVVEKYTVENGLPNEFMTFIFEDSKGVLWFGGLGGLSEYKDGKFTNYTTQNGLAGNYVRTIYEDRDGVFWIGTYDEGMSRFKDGRFVNYKSANGLNNDGVFAIQEDRNNNFWISSNRGIYRVNRRELNDFADGKIERINSVSYGKEDGMLSNECNGGRQPASIEDKDGNFWFPTQDGVVVVNPSHESYNFLPPTVVVESATVERKNININQGLNIDAGQKNIEINFTGISFIRPEQIKFKYKLEGHDTDWIDAGMHRTAYYSYLPPGNYRFLVKAANSDGIWNENAAEMNLQMQPFFYQTSWFYLVCIATGTLLLFVVWKISVHQLESRERRLAKMVNEKTEELRKANGELLHLANSDGLTKVGNRRFFEKFFADEWSRANRSEKEISLILLDVDHFKLYNDTYGHQLGDDCLKKVAEALKFTIRRPTDLLARFGGEEFAIVLGDTNSEGALNIAKQVIESVRNLKIPHRASKTSDCITISVGVATTFVTFDIEEADMIKAADDALYQAKENGRNRIVSTNLTVKLDENPVLQAEFIG